jgi:Arc/MetJ-type ribon-helix-helix transcriptional regulator
MKTVKVKLPEKLGLEIYKYIKAGWFNNEVEFIKAALQDFIRHNKLKLTEEFMREDIKWALKEKKNR